MSKESVTFLIKPDQVLKKIDDLDITYGHDFRVNVIRTYSRVGQDKGNIAFRHLTGFGGSGWESESIRALYNETAVSTTYIQAYCQNHSIPILTINRTNYNTEIPRLQTPGWFKDRVRDYAQQGYTVIVPDRGSSVWACSTAPADTARTLL